MARSLIDPAPSWTSLLPPPRSSSRSRSSSQVSIPKPTSKRPKNGSRSQIQTSLRADPRNTNSLASNRSLNTTTTTIYSGGTVLRRYNITTTRTTTTNGDGTNLPDYTASLSQQLDSSPPLLALSIPSSTPPSIPIDWCTHPSAPDHHHPCPHGCDRSETSITSVSFPISNPVSHPLTDPVTEPIFPSDPLDIFPTNTTSEGSGSRARSTGLRRSSNFSREWRHDPKRNKKAQEAARRIMEGCYSRKKGGSKWGMRDRVRRWGRELGNMEGLRASKDGGAAVVTSVAAAAVGRRGEEGEGKGEARWSWRRGWKGDNGLGEFGGLKTKDKLAAAAAAAIPKPPRNSVVMEQLHMAEGIGAGSTETSFGSRTRNHLRQAEEKDRNNRKYADYADRGREVHEHGEKMQSKQKHRTSGIWKRGLEKVKKLLISSTDIDKARSASRTAETRPYIAARAKIVDTSFLHPHWKGRHLGEVKGTKEDHPPSESPAGALLPSSYTRPKHPFPQPAAMEVPETTTTMDRNNKTDESDDGSMVAPPTTWYVDENGESHFEEGKRPRTAKEKGKGIDYSLYHEDSVFKVKTRGFPSPRPYPGPKERCQCRNCTPTLDLLAMTPTGNQGNGSLLQTYQGLIPSSRMTNSTRSSWSISSSQTPPEDQFPPRPALRSSPTYLGSLLTPYQDTWALPPLQISGDFSQAPEFTAFTHTPTGRFSGTFQESTARRSLTPSRHGSHEEEEVNNFRSVTRREKRPRDSVEQNFHGLVEGGEAYYPEVKKHAKSLRTTTGEQIPTRTWTETWTKTPTEMQTKTPQIPAGQQRTTRPQSLVKNHYHPYGHRQTPKSDKDRPIWSSSRRITTEMTSNTTFDSDREHGHEIDIQERGLEDEQYDIQNNHLYDRASSYVGPGQRPPEVFFTRPPRRALPASASSSSSSSSSFSSSFSPSASASASAFAFASGSAALPSPVPEEGGSNIADPEEEDPQIYDNPGHQSADRHGRSHHDHYSRSSRNNQSNSNGGNPRSFRTSWSLSISVVSTRARNPRNFRNSKKREGKSNSNNSNDSNFHAGPSSWYETKTTTSTNRRRSLTASTTGTGSSRVSPLDNLTTNDSFSASRTHSHSRTHSNETTGTTGTMENGNDSSTLEETGESGTGLRYARTASFQVETDLLITPLEEVEHYYPRPPPSDSLAGDELEGIHDDLLSDALSDAPSDPPTSDSPANHGHGEGRGYAEWDRQRDEGEDNMEGSWEWERGRGRERGRTGTRYDDVGGEYERGGWRMVDGGNGRVNERGGGGGGVNIEVKELKDEGTETGTETETGTGMGEFFTIVLGQTEDGKKLG